MNNLNVSFISDDTTIKTILARHCRDVIKPPPPHDIALTSLVDGGTFWIIVKCFDPSDPGFVAYGIPEPSTLDDRKQLADLLIGTMRSEIPMALLTVNPPETN